MGLPLSLYIHIPWCVRKCPYCDFNSHQADAALPEEAYVAALLSDLAMQVGDAAGRSIETIFIGGGTPSLFSGRAIGRLLEGVDRRLPLAPDAEITLEANPGAAEASRFAEYRKAGVNRLSIGVQSLDDAKLSALGRIHDRNEALAAVDLARAAGFDNLNLDLMYGLPRQSLGEALADLDAVIALQPEHLSWYQLTLEPNTLFHRRPPPLPDDDDIGDIMDAGMDRLASSGFERYEISAFARQAERARHNVNYWQFGDYLGIGAGAHGKITLPDGRIVRRMRPRHPKAYLEENRPGSSERVLTGEELPIEFMLNALRLIDGVPAHYFPDRTGLSLDAIAGQLRKAYARELLAPQADHLRPTPLGLRYLNELLLIFETA